MSRCAHGWPGCMSCPAAIEAARQDGYRAGVERAANLLNERAGATSFGDKMAVLHEAEKQVRALAPSEVSPGAGEANPVLGMAMELLRDIRDNWDCDEDAHKHGTRCRCCIACDLLALYDHVARVDVQGEG